MKKRISASLKNRIVVFLLCLLIPLVLALNVYAIYINASFTRQMADLNQAQLAGYVDRVAQALTTAEGAMGDIISGNFQFRRLVYKLRPLEAYTNAYSAYNACKSVVIAQKGMAGLVVYSPVNGRYMPAWADFFTGVEDVVVKRDIRQYVLGLPQVEAGLRPTTWTALEFGNKVFLCRLSSYRDVFLFCLMDLETLAAGQEPDVAFAQNGRYLTNRALAEENGFSVPPANGKYLTTQGLVQRYLLMAQPLPGTALVAVSMLPAGGAGQGGFQLLLLAISLLAILLVPFGYRWISGALLRPMGDLVQVMETAATGDLTVRADNRYRDREFKTMANTFNGMMDQIQTLRIEAYEKELDVQQAQLSFLQMQIRPHFYLNCMKNLYGMAQEHQIDDIQKMLVLLSDYLRYMMQSDTDWVTLEEELQNSRNYIRLQHFTQAYPPECNISVDTTALQVPIPPITVLTFVENCIKYADPDSRLVIQLRARRLATEEGPMLLLAIHDNGKGFPPQLLERLNHLDEALLPDSHVGINNVWRRLKLLYQDNFGLVFSNDHGAQVELFLPTGEQDDTADS